MNKKSTGISKARIALVMTLAVLVLPAGYGFALDIHNIVISVTEYRTDGVSDSVPYEFWVSALGNDITQVRMTTPSSSVYYLEEWDQYNWRLSIEDDGYTTLTSLRAVFPTGNYVFTFNGGEDSVTVNHNPTVPTGFANITYPVHNSNDVPLNPTLTWDDCSSYGTSLMMSLEDEEVGMLAVEFFADIALTSWTSLPLNPGRQHTLEVSVFAGTGSQPYLLQTDGLDSFDYYDLFENCNAVVFTTINPVVSDTISTKTKWITCNIWPPEGYDVSDIKTDSILLNGYIQPVRVSIRNKQQILVVKFPTSGLTLEPGTLELTISGELNDATIFELTDSVEVIQKGGKPN